jgi:hypothetical protein
MWFETLTGFCEESPQQVRKNISIDGQILKSHVNGKEFTYGVLETPNLGDLRNSLSNEIPKGKLSVREVIGDAQHLHKNELNAGAVFQVASQFNLLEMISPNVTPEEGIGGYEGDPTQGPACAVAAGAGTIYRNYFANVNGQIGQSTENQIDCLADIGTAIGNSDNNLWEMKNGYVLASSKGLREISQTLKAANESEIDELRKLLRIGIQWNTEVTIANSGHKVSQAYCSALPVAYSPHSSQLWMEFAKLVLEASYEATICVGIMNYVSTTNKTLYLTLLGGGTFGNKIEWIINAIHRSLNLYKNVDLDLVIVSYGRSNEYVRELIRQFSK